jgi:malto-oligosyltrehalose trehalohydrolase
MSAPPRNWGAVVLDDGQVRFRCWAPSHERLVVRLEDTGHDEAMDPVGGWHELTTRLATPGSLYSLVLPDGRCVPDPASLRQPQGVEGPSEVVDLSAHRWKVKWEARPWHECVLYELHVGAFTPEGTFRAAIDKLPHLAALGISAIELMPVGAFAGDRNWGYDGVFPYAPSAAYGRPEDLQALVDAAHGLGIMVILDVVYNHFGPVGASIGAVAPAFFTQRHQTPWGAGFDFAQPPVRQFFVDNALHWLGHYRCDGLRLDAVHAIADDAPVHILDEIAAAVHAHCGTRHLILENEHNEPQRLERQGATVRSYTAQWNDDLHHVLHVAATGEATGYYADYAGNRGMLTRAIAEGFAFQGEFMPYRGSTRGARSAHLPPAAFVSFVQNHDQIGNRALGERLTTLASPAALHGIAAVYLLMPQIPMLFMGEEWGSTRPFMFFCDFKGQLRRDIAQGRKQEFSRFPQFSDPDGASRIPDPSDRESFELAKLDWESLASPAHARWLAWYTDILAVRRREVIPRLPRILHGGRVEELHSGVFAVTWTAADETLRLVANLADAPAEPAPETQGRLIWQQGECTQQRLGPWAVRWSVCT